MIDAWRADSVSMLMLFELLSLLYLRNLHIFMWGVGGTKWSLAAAVLATHGLHMLSCSRGTLPLDVFDCQSPLTMKHILLNCANCMALCQHFYIANSMRFFY